MKKDRKKRLFGVLLIIGSSCLGIGLILYALNSNLDYFLTPSELKQSDENVVLAHERLAIVDPKSGKQPLYSKDGRYVLAANGEIYNHLELREKYAKNHDFLTCLLYTSDAADE